MTQGLSVWGWVGLFLVLWLLSKTSVGNQMIRYGVLLLILLIVLMNAGKLVKKGSA